MWSHSKQKKRISTLANPQTTSNTTTSLSLGNSDYYATSNQQIQSFSFAVDRTSTEDATLYWQYNIPFLKPNQKGVVLATGVFQTVLTNYVGDDFPMKISFGFRNFSGFSNKKGEPTNKFLVLQLISTTIKTQMGLTSRDLIYRSQMDNVWPLGNMRNLQMQIYLDDDPIALGVNLTTPIEVAFKLVHVSV